VRESGWSQSAPSGGAGAGGGDVLVLGAGFSRAVSDRMPLVDELGNACLETDDLGSDRRVPVGGFTGGSFETWLSRLADEQPYLSVQENLENQALFERFSAAISEVLGRRVHDTLADGCPGWLSEFVRVAHQRRATLITFNYDPLIECVVGTCLLYDWGRPEPVFWAEVTGDVPNWPPGPAIVAAEPADSFRLLKLHGSLNWYWAPRDASGVSIARRSLPGVFGAPEWYTEEQRRRVLPGRVPFVVPPSAVKSPYYRNPLIREIWQQAASSLRTATRVFLVGYSLPPADLTFAGMLTDALGESAAKLAIIDPHALAVKERLKSLGFPDDRIHVAGSGAASPVEAFTAFWRDQASADLLDRLRRSEPETIDDPLLIVWGQRASAPITQIHEAGGVVTLTGDPVSASPQAATRPRDQSPASVLPTLREVLQRSASGNALQVQAEDGRRQAVIGWTVARSKTGYGRGVWNALTPSGTP
jgi:hypothetical protein